MRTNYTYAHTIDNSTNEFFTSVLNPRRAQDSHHINEDRGNSDLDVRQKFALSLVYNVPNFAPKSSGFMNALVNGFVLSSTFLAQTGQPVTLSSGNAGIDSNRNGDTAGDRTILNPNATGNLGTDVNIICRNGAGATSIGSAVAGDPNGVPGISGLRWMLLAL